MTNRLFNAGSCDSKITYIDGKKGVLMYRGWVLGAWFWMHVVSSLDQQDATQIAIKCMLSTHLTSSMQFKQQSMPGTTLMSWQSKVTLQTVVMLSCMANCLQQLKNRSSSQTWLSIPWCMSSSSSSTRDSVMMHIPWPSWLVWQGLCQPFMPMHLTSGTFSPTEAHFVFQCMPCINACERSFDSLQSNGGQHG